MATLAFELVVFLVGQRDFAAADPLWYAQIAKALSVDPSVVFRPDDVHPHVMRIGLTVPLAVIYRVFGVSTPSTNVISLLAGWVCVIVVWAGAPTPRAKIVACLLCATCTPLMAQANMLNVDLPSTALMAVSVLFVQRRWFVAAMCAWFAAFLVKETALWCAPIWLYVIARALRAESWRISVVGRRFAPAMAVGFVLALGYLGLCAWLWNDPFARFHGIDRAVASVGDNPSYAQAWVLSAGRMTWQVPHLLSRMFGATLLLVVAGFWLVRGGERIWIVATATIVLLYWFGSSQLGAYTPLPISVRLLVPVLPFALITAAIAADEALARIQPSPMRVACATAFAVAVAVPALRKTASEFTRRRPETAAFAALRDEVRNDAKRQFVLVCGEPKCIAISRFYFGFEDPPNLQVMFARDFAAAPLSTGVRVRALVNMTRASGIRRVAPQLDMTAAIDDASLPAIVHYSDVRLYDAGDGTQLHAALERNSRNWRAPAP